MEGHQDSAMIATVTSLRCYYVPGTVLSDFHVLSLVTGTKPIGGRIHIIILILQIRKLRLR